MKCQSICRSGMTLYEVVLALAILLGATSVLVSFISLGRHSAIQTRLRTEAALHCQSKMSEVIVGIEPLQSVQNVPNDDGSANWAWSLQVLPGIHQDLLDLQVTVSRAPLEGTRDATSFTLVRSIRNPELFAVAEPTGEGGE